MHITDWEAHKKKMLKNPKIRQALKENELEYQIAKALIEARIKKGLTQADVAKKLRISQQAYAKLESPKGNPSLDTLKRISEALDAEVDLKLVS